ncbi:GDP-L-fucose synthase family protein [Rhodovibrio salinarum]|uniref:GDP-L-fucose synthase n=1 Tax=Rhodovibrio salinarum TaxID=1087 RepID=A0A934QG92_9PROT|nr:GDP-L-fucose synthase [Rhodovibrio salinarum]MBK1696219.1 GDP-L-fucose synthase [Rhodovibrio salinarum]
METGDKIYVAGDRGLVGSAITRRLAAAGYTNLIGRSRHALDLTDQQAVRAFFEAERPDHVFMCAAKVGGIRANNSYPADFIHLNQQIQTNVIDAAWRSGVRKFLFMGSSCIYPRDCPQPIKEEYLLTGPLEVTNEGYAIAKIAGLKTCMALRQQYGFDAISVLPANLYGPGDNFDLDHAHVIPALIRRFHTAKENGDRHVTVWGSGTARREFLFVDDLADASIFVMNHYTGAQHLNVGSGKDLPIADLARLIAEIVGFEGEIVQDPSMPDGTPRKRLDSSRLRDLGWTPSVDLRTGLTRTYAWFLDNRTRLREGRGHALSHG